MADFRIMTFNIRGAPDDDGVNIWPNRAALNVETIRRCAPDLIGFQEAQAPNLETYQHQLKDYQSELWTDLQSPRQTPIQCHLLESADVNARGLGRSLFERDAALLVEGLGFRSCASG